MRAGGGVRMHAYMIERKTAVKVLWYWGPAVLYAAAIFFLSSQSHPEQYVPELFLLKLGDKVPHAIEYALLGFLCYRAFRHAAGSWGEQYAVLMAVVAATAYGASDEWHQAFVPFREPDRWDLVSDLLGAALGALAWAWIEPRQCQACLPEMGMIASDGSTERRPSPAPSKGVSAELWRFTDND